MAKHNSTPGFRSAKALSPKSARQFPYQRQLKVRKGYWDHQFCRRNPYNKHFAPVPVPWVQIKGYWLNQAGFSIDTPIRVTIRKGRMVLTAVQVSRLN